LIDIQSPVRITISYTYTG